MSKWKIKYGPALWVKVFGKDGPVPSKVRSGAMKTISEKMRLMMVQYKKDKRKWWRLEASLCCRKCGRKMKTNSRSVHHSHGRLGNLLLYKPWWIPLCIFPCHKWVDENPNEARALGLLCQLGEWNVQPNNYANNE
jgi:hypothetical protein